MSIGTLTTRNQYVGNGALTTYFYTFRIIQVEDIEVYLFDGTDETLMTLGTDYTVTNVNQSGGGSVIFTTPPPVDVRITLVRAAKALQPETYVENDSFPAASHELALDRATTNIQTIKDRQELSLRLPISTNLSSVNTNIGFISTDVSGYAITVNSTGDGFTFAPSSELPDDVVTNPNAVTDESIVRFDGTSGTSIQDSKITINDAGNLALNEPLSLISLLSDNGSKTTIQATSAQVADINYKLPVQDGPPGYVLGTLGGGQLVWVENEGPPIDPDSLAARTDVFISGRAAGDILGSANGNFWVPFQSNVDYQPLNANISVTDTAETRTANINMNGNEISNALTIQLQEAVETIAATPNVDMDANIFALDHDTNITLNFQNVLASHQYFQFILIRVKDDSATPRSITFNNVLWPGGTVPTLTQTAEAVDIFLFKTITGGANWFGFKIAGDLS